jgi:hypothetical protein
MQYFTDTITSSQDSCYECTCTSTIELNQQDPLIACIDELNINDSSSSTPNDESNFFKSNEEVNDLGTSTDLEPSDMEMEELFAVASSDCHIPVHHRTSQDNNLSTMPPPHPPDPLPPLSVDDPQEKFDAPSTEYTNPTLAEDIFVACKMLTPNATFNTPNELFDCIEAAFKQGGIAISKMVRQTKQSFKRDEEIECFRLVYGVGDKGTSPSRGRHFCKEAGCTWNVSYSYIRKNHCYVILDKNSEAAKYKTHFCLHHNHTASDDSFIDGIFVVKNESDLTIDEMKMLNALALAHSGMPTIQRVMLAEFNMDGKWSYDSALLYRVVKKIRNNKFGENQHRMKDLMEMFEKAASNGGRSEYDVDDIFRLVGTRFQTSRQVQYMDQYGSYFVEVDGTYSTNRYGLTLMPWVTADCLGITHIGGLSTSLSENTNDVLKSGHLFGVASTFLDDNVSCLCLRRE